MECADEKNKAHKQNTGGNKAHKQNTGGQDPLQVGCILCLTAGVFVKWPTSSLAFAFASCFDLILLFFALRNFERTSRNSNPKIDRQLKITVLFISIHLIVVFSHRVASVMPVLARVIIWSMSTTTIGAIIYLFFYHEDCEHTDHKRPATAAPTKLCRGSHDNNNHED